MKNDLGADYPEHIRSGRTHTGRTRDVLLRRIAVLAISLGAAFAMACTDGGGTGAGTGGIGLFVTDGPAQQFEAVNITVSDIELIGGPDGTISIFQGSQTFDLLNLLDVSELFAAADRIPTGHYAKIRLYVSEIELLQDDGMGGVDAYYPKLPANGKIDLLPKGGFTIHEGEMLSVEIDIDANKSLHIVGTGNHRFQFRPVVFVKVLRHIYDGKLTRVHGLAHNIDTTAGTLEICHLRRPLAWLPYLARHADADDYVQAQDAGMSLEDFEVTSEDQQPHFFRCVDVQMLSGAGYFDGSGMPTDLSALGEGDPLTVVGHAKLTTAGFELLGKVALFGPRGTFTALRGVVASTPDANDQFDLDLTDGQGFLPGTTLGVQLFDETHIFDRLGTDLDTQHIEVGLDARAVGVIDTVNDLINTAIVLLDFGAPETEVLRGELTLVDPATGRIEVLEAGETVASCADVSARTRIYEIDAQHGTATQIGIDALVIGSDAHVWGYYPTAQSPCLSAGTLIVEPPPAVPAP